IRSTRRRGRSSRASSPTSTTQPRSPCSRSCSGTRTCRTSSPSSAWTSSPTRTSSWSPGHAGSSASCRSRTSSPSSSPARRGAAGEIGILARHAPLVATLKAGSTRVYLGGTEIRTFATGPGFFKVETDRALALVDDAVDVNDIDDERARAQLEAAQAELAKIDAGESTADRWQLEQRVKHAENQLSATGRSAS